MCSRDFDMLQEPQGAAVGWCYATILLGSKMDLFKNLSGKASTGCVFRGKNQRLNNTALFLPCGLQEKFRRRLSQMMPEAETWVVVSITTTHLSVTHSCQTRLPCSSSVAPLKQSSHIRYCQQAPWAVRETEVIGDSQGQPANNSRDTRSQHNATLRLRNTSVAGCPPA